MRMYQGVELALQGLLVGLKGKSLGRETVDLTIGDITAMRLTTSTDPKIAGRLTCATNASNVLVVSASTAESVLTCGCARCRTVSFDI